MKIGVCGTGRMGSSIVQRLMSVGHEVGVWNRNSAKTKPLIDGGAKLFASPAELVQGCDVVIVMLLNDAATEAVYRGSNGILKSNLAGKLVIDMSTVRPDTMKSIGTSVAQQGAAFVECPVGGSTGPAREGKLFGFVGGAKVDVIRAMPVLEQLCRRVEHIGELGSGATMKLAVNLPLLVYWQALGEALTICKPLNLPADRLIDILSDTAGTPTAMKGRGAAIARVLGGQPMAKPRSALVQRKRIWPPRFNSVRHSVPSFLSRQARLPALRKRKLRALAMPTQPRFPSAGADVRPPRLNLKSHQLCHHAPNNRLD
jgi:3-hydroxyisobutyrate dehydrogenase